MEGKPSGESGGESNIKELRVYFNSLNAPQKKEFIEKLQQKLTSVKSAKYKDFLSECIEAYNQEVHADDKSIMVKDATTPNLAVPTAISAESIAIAFASMLNPAKTDTSAPSIGPRLVGTWQRECDGKAFYYKFNDDGTFETNEVNGRETLEGHYNAGFENAILMEPHELLQVSSLMLSVSGNSLTIGLMDGSLYEYKRINQ